MIHPTAIIDPSAKIAADVEIGPWTVIGAHVEIGEKTWIGPHVVIRGPTKIGRENKIYQFASVGEDPQDKKFKGELTTFELGDRNVIREFCTINRGTVQDKGTTRIGHDNLLMAYVHIAHDCIIGNHTIFVNNASLAGHVIVDDHAILGGFSGVLQFCRLGVHSFTCMGSLVDKDIPPFVKVAGQNPEPCGLNTLGLQRQGFSSETILQLRRAYKIIYRKGLTTKEALLQLQDMVFECPPIKTLVEFIQQSERGIVR